MFSKYLRKIQIDLHRDAGCLNLQKNIVLRDKVLYMGYQGGPLLLLTCPYAAGSMSMDLHAPADHSKPKWCKVLCSCVQFLFWGEIQPGMIVWGLFVVCHFSYLQVAVFAIFGPLLIDRIGFPPNICGPQNLHKERSHTFHFNMPCGSHNIFLAWE